MNYPYYGEHRSDNEYNEVGKTVTFTVDIYSNHTCRLYIYVYAGSYNPYYITIPANTPGTYSVTRVIPSNVEHILYRVEPRDYTDSNMFCYTDNWRLTIIE